MWFMKDWKVGSPLQNLKNITVGSKRPKGVMNVPFHWFSSLMDIVEPPFDVKLGKECGILHVIN